MRTFFSGQDSPTQTALPAGEFLQPLPLAALAMLVANDWWLKPSTWAPAFITGKLSDAAGLLFFPLLATALFDCLLLALYRLGLRVDFSLRRYKLVGSILLTGLLFSALKLWPAANQGALSLLRGFGLPAQVVLDPTDLLALPLLWFAWRIGKREIARLPLGRLEILLHCRKENVGEHLHDLIACGAKPENVDAFAAALKEYRSAPNASNEHALSQRLAVLRDPSRPSV